MASGLITVYAAPSAYFVPSDTAGCAPLEVNFSAPTGAFQYLWDFGDGATSNLQTPSHTYGDGQFSPSLEVTDTNGCTDFYESQIINAQNLNLQGTYNFNGGCMPADVSFGATGASYYHWDFGDGATSTLASSAYTYSANGTYVPVLIGYNDLGCADTLILDSIYVGPTIISQKYTRYTIRLFTRSNYIFICWSGGE